MKYALVVLSIVGRTTVGKIAKAAVYVSLKVVLVCESSLWIS